MAYALDDIIFQVPCVEYPAFCLDCYGVIYGLTPELQGMEKLIKKTKESGEA